jgi:transposase-like protein
MFELALFTLTSLLASRYHISFINTRNRTSSKFVYCMLYLYISGLALRKTSDILSHLYTRNHVSIWNWIQKYRPQKLKSAGRKVLQYTIDETMLKGMYGYIWLRVATESENRQILALFYLINLRKETCLLLRDSLII